MGIDYDISGNYDCVCCGKPFYYTDNYDYKEVNGLLMSGDLEVYSFADIEELPSFCGKCLGISLDGKLDTTNKNGLFLKLCTGCENRKKCGNLKNRYYGGRFIIYRINSDDLPAGRHGELKELNDNIKEQPNKYLFAGRIDYTTSEDGSYLSLTVMKVSDF